MIRPCIYKLLRHAGHSAQKAAEIILDASRGDELARRWIFGLFRMRRQPE